MLLGVSRSSSCPGRCVTTWRSRPTSESTRGRSGVDGAAWLGHVCPACQARAVSAVRRHVRGGRCKAALGFAGDPLGPFGRLGRLPLGRSASPRARVASSSSALSRSISSAASCAACSACCNACCAWSRLRFAAVASARASASSRLACLACSRRSGLRALRAAARLTGAAAALTSTPGNPLRDRPAVSCPASNSSAASGSASAACRVSSKPRAVASVTACPAAPASLAGLLNEGVDDLMLLLGQRAQLCGVKRRGRLPKRGAEFEQRIDLVTVVAHQLIGQPANDVRLGRASRSPARRPARARRRAPVSRARCAHR